MQGLKAFPDCQECQCYPECRTDCPDRIACMARLPEYKPQTVAEARALLALRRAARPDAVAFAQTLGGPRRPEADKVRALLQQVAR